jgi:hypothetical protein
MSENPIGASRLDIRLGRHHGISLGANRVDLSVTGLCELLMAMSDTDLVEASRTADPELALLSSRSQRACLSELFPAAPNVMAPPAPSEATGNWIAGLIKKFELSRK